MKNQTSKTGWFGSKQRLWISVIAVAILAFVVFNFFFVKRSVADYPMGHKFSVSDPAFIGSALALSDPILSEGNSIELLNNGVQIFPALLQAIRSAEKSINFETFLYESGFVGKEFREALCERAKAGVKVRVLLDGVGSGTALDDEDVDAFKEGGCEFRYYHPTRSWRFDQLNRRTHRRVLVIDGKVAFTGGVGFADRWAGNADSPDHWRDIQVRMEGPIVARMQSAFNQHWIKGGGETLSGPNEFPLLAPAGNLKVQVVASESFSYAPLALVQAVAFSSAVKSITITNSYCAPSEVQVAQLCEAVKRGVVVRLLLPGTHNDQPMTKAAGRTAYGDLLEGGVQIFEYEPTMLHTKSMVIDGIFTIFGSSNFDARSAQINEELDLTIYDANFGREMEAIFEKDLLDARPYTLEKFKSRGLWERFTEWAVLPLHSQM